MCGGTEYFTISGFVKSEPTAIVDIKGLKIAFNPSNLSKLLLLLEAIRLLKVVLTWMTKPLQIILGEIFTDGLET